MWLIIFRVFLVLWALFWCAVGVVVLYALITDKKTRDRVWEDLKRRSRSRGSSRTFTDEQFEKYRNTGNRNYLIDEDYEE